eukprot:553229_1
MATEVGKFLFSWVPVVGNVVDIYDGYVDGDIFTFCTGVGGLVLDVATLGSASVVKNTAKAMNKCKKLKKAMKAAQAAGDLAKFNKLQKAYKATTKSIKAAKGLKKASDTAKAIKRVKDAYGEAKKGSDATKDALKLYNRYKHLNLT